MVFLMNFQMHSKMDQIEGNNILVLGFNNNLSYC
jgi:hypothetical protein